MMDATAPTTATGRAEAAVAAALAARATQQALTGGAGGAGKHGAGGGETNIQVVVRCRPPSLKELADKEAGVVRCDPLRREVAVQQVQATRTFTFDRVFGPDSKQTDVYNDVVAPIVREVLLGYSCTIFAYGQTGTGKTHTMEGARIDECSSIGDNPDAGIIPRTLEHLFATLGAQDDEFSVRVSQVELYNEEVRDLLSPEDDNRKLRIFDDPKSKGCVIQGVEEVLVSNAKDVIQIMQMGSNKRRVAATALNPNSSRSHCVFSITVHITPKGEDLLKIGKLNLVDLAGSENISKSGAENKRAREACAINQSLLTLGRVINALVDKAPHVPYRESKLTRLLQDSLGGRTKTCIIATISPSKGSFDETLSTLDYAHRAKNIRNRPEVNQCVTKKAIIQQYATEIERLKSDLQATQAKNGYYMSPEHHKEIEETLRTQKQQIEDYILAIELKHEQLGQLEKTFTLTKDELVQTRKTFGDIEMQLTQSRKRAAEIERELERTSVELRRREMQVAEHTRVEQQLHHVAETLLGTVDATVDDISGLHQKIDRKANIENQNRGVLGELQQRVDEQAVALKRAVDAHAREHGARLQTVLATVSGFAAQHSQAMAESRAQIDGLQQWVGAVGADVRGLLDALVVTHGTAVRQAAAATATHLEQVEAAHAGTAAAVAQMLATVSGRLGTLEQQTAAFVNELSVAAAALAHASTAAADETRVTVSQLRELLRKQQAAQTAALDKTGVMAQRVAQQHAAQRQAQRAKLFAAMASMLDAFNDEDAALFATADGELVRHNADAASQAAQLAAVAEQHVGAIEGSVAALDGRVQREGMAASAVLEQLRRECGAGVRAAKGTAGEMHGAVAALQTQVHDAMARLADDENSALNGLHADVAERLGGVGVSIAQLEKQTGDDTAALADALATQTAASTGLAGTISEQVTEADSRQMAAADDVVQQLGLLSNETTTAVRHKIAVDLPTGKTPKKKAYQYPRSWQRSRPLQEILEDDGNGADALQV